MIFVPAKGVKTQPFDGDTLIIPIVSTGNVGQLAVDLFITTGRTKSHHAVEKVGYLDTDLVAPVAGYEVFGPGQPPQLCVNLELYRFADKGVTMLQQRGPVFLGEEQAFAEELVRWALESGFKSVLALSGADAAEGLDPTPLGRGAIKCFRAKKPPGTSPDKSHDPPPPCALEEALRDAGVGEFDALGSAVGAGLVMSQMGGAPLDFPGGGLAALRGGPEEGEAGGDGDGGLKDASGLADVLSRFPHLPTGTGVAGPLCKKAAFIKGKERDDSLPLVLLLHFCGEGDNTPEAIEMANAVNTALGILSSSDGFTSSHDNGLFSWSSPLSWASLYGPPPGDDALAYQ